MSLDTSRPRAAGGTYDFSTHGRPSGNNLNSMILLPNVSAELWTTSWSNTLTTFRPLPALDANGQLTPYRRSADPSAFGDWIRGYMVFKGGQNGTISFVLYDHAGNPDYDLRDNPAHVLYTAIKGAVDTGHGHPSWVPLLAGGNNRSAALNKPTTCFFLQCLLFEHKHKILQWPRGLGPNDKTIVMQLSQDAGRKLVDAANQLNPNWQGGDPGNYEQALLYGNLVDYEFGRFIRTCQADGHLAQQNVAPQMAQPGNMGTFIGAPQQQQGGQQQFKGYDLRVEQQFQVGQQLLTAAIPENLRTTLQSRAKRWSDLIRIPTNEEQVAMLARSFAGDLIEFAFRDHPEWLTQDILAITRARTTAAQFPNYPGAAAYAPGPAGFPQQPGGFPQPGFPQQGYQQPGGFPQQQMQPGFPQQQPGFPQQQPAYGQPQTSGYMAPAQPQPGGYPQPEPPQTQQPQQPQPGNAWAGTGFGGAGIPGQDPALQPGMHQMPSMGAMMGAAPQQQMQQPQGQPQSAPQGQPQPQMQMQQPQGQIPGQGGLPPVNTAFGQPGAPANVNAAVQQGLAAAQNLLGGQYVGPPGQR